MDLYPHQEAGVAWLLRHPRGGLFDEQGLGKTAQVIVAADLAGANRVLVVAPTVVAHNWSREFGLWSPSRRVQVLGASADGIDSQTNVLVVPHSLVYRKAVRDRLVGYDTSILDEAHQLRTPSAQRTDAFFLGADAICRRTERCWALTGTPQPNNPGEMWAMLAGMASWRLRHGGRLLSYRQFRERFCVLVPSGYGRGERVVGAKNVEELRQRLDGFYLRRRETEVLTLPPMRFGTVALTADCEAWPHELTRLGATADDILAAAQRDKAFSTWRRLCGVAKAPAAADLLASDLASGSHKMVVFCVHLEVVDTLARRLGALRLTGSTPAAERQRIVDQFQRSPTARVLIAQLQSGGVGITLTAACDVVFVEQSFVPGDNAQAAKRCHRIGQTKPVLVRFLSLAGSVDELLVDILARKTAMIAEVMP